MLVCDAACINLQSVCRTSITFTQWSTQRMYDCSRQPQHELAPSHYTSSSKEKLTAIKNNYKLFYQCIISADNSIHIWCPRPHWLIRSVAVKSIFWHYGIKFTDYWCKILNRLTPAVHMSFSIYVWCPKYVLHVIICTYYTYYYMLNNLTSQALTEWIVITFFSRVMVTCILSFVTMQISSILPRVDFRYLH